MRLLVALPLALSLVGCGAHAAPIRRGTGPGHAVAVVRQGEYSGELALIGRPVTAHYAAEDAMVAHCGGRVRFVTAEEAGRLAIADPSVPGKWDETFALTPDVERLYYVCITRERVQQDADVGSDAP